MLARPTPEDIPIANRACPRCGAELAAVGVGRGATIHACGACHGGFLPPLAWSAIFDAPHAAGAIEARLPPRAVRPATLVPPVRCPVCQREMERTRFAATSEIVIDTCRWHHGVWVDAGEIDAIVRHAEHRERIGEDAAAREADEAWARAHGRDPVAIALEIEQARIRAASAGRMRKGAQAGLAGAGLLLVIRLLALASCSTSSQKEHARARTAEEQRSARTATGPTGSSRPGARPTGFGAIGH